MTALELQKRWGLHPHTAKHVEAMLRAFPRTRITSGRRSVRHNREVGGVPNSFHLTGRAVDFVPVRSDWQAFIRHAWSVRVSPNCTGPEEVIDEGDHVHCAW